MMKAMFVKVLRLLGVDVLLARLLERLLKALIKKWTAAIERTSVILERLQTKLAARQEQQPDLLIEQEDVL